MSWRGGRAHRRQGVEPQEGEGGQEECQAPAPEPAAKGGRVNPTANRNDWGVVQAAGQRSLKPSISVQVGAPQPFAPTSTKPLALTSAVSHNETELETNERLPDEG